MPRDYVEDKVFATCIEDLLVKEGEIVFGGSSMIFYSPTIYPKEKVEINYSSITWIEKKKSLGFISNRMIIHTKEQGEYIFVSKERDKIIEFLLSKASSLDRKPSNSKVKLRNTAGEKIRRQYFGMYIYMVIPWIIQFWLFIPIMEMVINGKEFSGYKAMEMLEVIATLVILLLPIVMLSLGNRYFFGRIVCVLNETGIIYKRGFISWKDIERIEYGIELPARYSIKDYCHARIVGKELDIKLLHCPCFFMWRAKKYNKDIKCKFSKDSITTIIIMALIPITLLILFLIFYKR